MIQDQFCTSHSILDVHIVAGRPHRSPVSDSSSRNISVFPLSSIHEYYKLRPVEYCSSIHAFIFWCWWHHSLSTYLMYRKRQWSIIKLSTSLFKNLSDFPVIVVCSSANSTSCSASLNTFIYSGSIGPLVDLMRKISKFYIHPLPSSGRSDLYHIYFK